MDPLPRPAGRSGAPGLTDREREILVFEGDWPAHVGNKAAAIRARFSITPARYYQLLARAVTRSDAGEVAPLVVKRSERRKAQRAARTDGSSASRRRQR